MIWSAEFKTPRGVTKGPEDEATFYDLIDALEVMGATSIVGGWEGDGTALSARFIVEPAPRGRG